MAWSTTSQAISVRVGLDHRDLGAHVAALVELPGAVVGHQPRGVDLGRRVGHPPLDRLALGERHAEGLRAAARIRTIMSSARCAMPIDQRRHLHPPRAEPQLHGREALRPPWPSSFQPATRQSSSAIS